MHSPVQRAQPAIIELLDPPQGGQFFAAVGQQFLDQRRGAARIEDGESVEADGFDAAGGRLNGAAHQRGAGQG